MLHLINTEKSANVNIHFKKRLKGVEKDLSSFQNCWELFF